MRGSVARNGIFGIKWRFLFKRYNFGLKGNVNISGLYPIQG